MTRKLQKLSTKQKLFLGIFILLNLYFLVIKSELYESKTALIVKDLGANTSASNLGLSLLGMSSSSQLQDSKIVEEYLKSPDVFELLDKKFDLTRYYQSDALDFVERLDDDATKEDVLEFYNKHLKIFYDEPSGILSIAFSHVDKQKAKVVLEFLVQKVEEKVNEFNRQKAIRFQNRTPQAT